LPTLFLGLFALSRIPGVLPENFSVAYALAFCAGVYFTRSMAWWLPLGAILLTDIALNVFHYHVAALDAFLLIKLAALGGIVALGRRFKPQMSWWKLVGGGLLGAVLFYLITNTASWLHDPGYPKTLAGWWQALTTGLPGLPPTWMFFRNTLLSGGLFTGAFVAAAKLTPQPEPEPEEKSEEGEVAEGDQVPGNAST
jgi:hypothetical protein